MYQIIIASHGPVANAMKESLQFFFKDLEKLHTIIIDKDGINKFSNEVSKLLKSFKDEEVLIFVDLFYGTPFNEFARQCSEKVDNFDIISGMNMPSLMEAINYQKQGKNLEDVIESIITAGSLNSFSKTINKTTIKEDDE